MGRYRTAIGKIIDVPGGAFIGQRALYVEPLNATLWAEPLAAVLGTQEMVDNLTVKETTVVEEIASWNTPAV